jgi:hypothetical protein
MYLRISKVLNNSDYNIINLLNNNNIVYIIAIHHKSLP